MSAGSRDELLDRTLRRKPCPVFAASVYRFPELPNRTDRGYADSAKEPARTFGLLTLNEEEADKLTIATGRLRRRCNAA